MFFGKKELIIFLSIVSILILPNPVFSLMESSNYKILFDSVNVGGGDSSSANYQLQDTVGEIATGNSNSTNFQMRAGYQQLNSSYITISTETIVDIGNLSGFSSSSSTVSENVKVTTDSYGGYQLNVVASGSPAMTSGSYSFDDYQPAGPEPDYNFLIGATDSLFGFSVSGDDVIGRYRNNGTYCASGITSTPQTCWDGFSVTTKPVARSTSSNHPAGTITRFDYRAEVGSDKFQEAGSYSANITMTAIAL